MNDSSKIQIAIAILALIGSMFTVTFNGVMAIALILLNRKYGAAAVATAEVAAKADIAAGLVATVAAKQDEAVRKVAEVAVHAAVAADRVAEVAVAAAEVASKASDAVDRVKEVAVTLRSTTTGTDQKLYDMKEILDAIHVLVNGPLGRALSSDAESKHRIAEGAGATAADVEASHEASQRVTDHKELSDAVGQKLDRDAHDPSKERPA